MWKSIGALSSPTNKAKDQVSYQAFAQTSRLKLNESLLSGENSPKFMQQYFSKKRSPQALGRSQSQKSVQILNYNSSSQQQINSPRFKGKGGSNCLIKNEAEVLSVEKFLLHDSIQNQKKEERDQEKYNKMNQSIQKMKEEQLRLKRNLQSQLGQIQKCIKTAQQEIMAKINQNQVQQASAKPSESIKPQILSKIKQQSIRFNQRIKDIQNRKELIKEKYRIKNGER